MRIALVTDAWRPQVNGVVTTLSATQRYLEIRGHEIAMLSPETFATVPCPTYPEIRLALFPRKRLAGALTNFEPDAIHIATEGPLGICARRYCVSRNLAFTTSYHTQFPQYVRKRVPVPETWSYAYLRRHHGRASRTLVATPQMRRDLLAHGFDNVVIWGRGVDTQQFTPSQRAPLDGQRPIMLYAGRVAVEKNLDAYLELPGPGTKYVVGDGPARACLASKYPDARFVGYRFGADLARLMASADVFVFPSRTDTFGLVMLEAMACGTPVAAYPVTGPIDVVENGVTGVLDDDLGRAVSAAAAIDREVCRRKAEEQSWPVAAEQFLSHLVAARTGTDLGA